MYAIHFDQTGYWDFFQCEEYPTFKTETEAWDYLKSLSLNDRYLIFKAKGA